MTMWLILFLGMFLLDITPFALASSIPSSGCRDENGAVHPTGPLVGNDPCKQCSCTPRGLISCRVERCSDLPCPRNQQIHRYGDCCSSCLPGCLSSVDTWVPNGPVWRNDPCENCTCDGVRGVLRCRIMQCTQPVCRNNGQPIVQPGQCCPICPVDDVSCTDPRTGHTYREGPMPSLHACEFNCQCTRTGRTCGRPVCPTVVCPNNAQPVMKPGQCCPTCPEITFTEARCIGEDGRYYGVGRMPGSTPCKTCYCTETGQITCRIVNCRSVRCAEGVSPVVKLGDCCPTCPDGICTDSNTGITHPLGPIADSDPCTSCECKDNAHIHCAIHTCEPLPCPQHLQITDPTRCCPSCPEGCVDERNNWVSPGLVETNDPCKECTCDGHNHRYTCRLQRCPDPACPQGYVPVNVPGACCPACEVAERYCVDYGTDQRHPVGPIRSSDPCRTCTCRARGWITCEYVPCSPVRCPDGQIAVHVPGQCCLTCQER